MHSIKIFFILISVLLILMCANQGFPPGGPEDKTPPLVLHTFPAADSTHISRNVRVQIEFSEAIIPRSVEESIFITPFTGDKVRYKWQHDRVLTIIFGDSLLPERTYIVTIGAGAKDRRNNMMTNSHTLAFSTGAMLDRGQISGNIYGDKVEGAQVWAYDLKETPEPNPAKSFPLYITQVGKDGAYRLTNMALGAYRLFAVMDRNVNNYYNAGFDLLGVAHRDVRLDSTSISDEPLNFRIALRDTTDPRVESARAPDNHHLDVRFSEHMLSDFLSDSTNYAVFSENDSLVIHDAFIDDKNRGVVHLATSEQTAALPYTLVVHHGKDLSGKNLAADSNSVVFSGSAVPDTLKPRYLTMTPRDSSKMVPVDSPLEFAFSKAMNPQTIARNLVVADTLGDTVRGSVTWRDKAHLIFTPQTLYKSETFYLATLPVDSVFDLFGNALADTLFKRRFTSMNPDTLSAIGGRLDDADPTATGPFFLTAKSANEKDPRAYELKVEGVGKFEFEKMIPGRYIIDLFRDQDGNDGCSWGDAFPFVPAERFYVFPDTIEIRSRWPDDGEEITLPR
jgi:hypothetical protein